MITRGSPCEVKPGFFKCKGSSVGLCVYCGRTFCAEHGVLLDEGQEVCNSKNCVAKREDVVVHLVYKEAVTLRNDAQQCGIEGCGGPMLGRCARCSGYFCGRHVGPREETIIEDRRAVERMATLCHHCFERRPIWLKK
jgi:hypothetical protein